MRRRLAGSRLWHLSAGRHEAGALTIVRPHGSADAQRSRSAECVANYFESELALASRHPQANAKGVVANGSYRLMAMVTAVGHRGEATDALLFSYLT